MAVARVKLAGICGAILSVFCLLTFAAGPALADSGSISGSVVGPSGPLSGATVTAYLQGSGTSAGSATTTTNGGGDYILDGLAYGSYLVEFTDSGYTTQWYDDQASPGTANPITISSPENQIVSADLQADGASGPPTSGPPTITWTPPTYQPANPGQGVESSTLTLSANIAYNQPSMTTETVYFQYGPTASYGQQTAGLTDYGYTSFPATARITNITPGTYHIRVVVTGSGSTSYGPDETYTVPAPPSLGQVTVSHLTAEGFTVTGNVDPHGQSGASYSFELSYDPLASDSEQILGNCSDHVLTVAWLRCHHDVGIGDAHMLGGTTAQTITLAAPTAFEMDPSVSGLATLRWRRPSATPSLYVRLRAGDDGGVTYGPEQRVTAPRPKAQTTATTGKATFIKASRGSCAGVALTGRANFSVGAVWAMFEYGPTRSFGSFSRAVALPVTDFAFGPPTTSKTQLLSTQLDLPGPADDACGDEITPNEKIYYRLVSDDGFGKGPSYGAIRAFKLHGNGGTNIVVTK